MNVSSNLNGRGSSYVAHRNSLSDEEKVPLSSQRLE